MKKNREKESTDDDRIVIREITEATLLYLCSGVQNTLGEELQSLYVEMTEKSPQELDVFRKMGFEKLSSQNLAVYKGLLLGFKLWDNVQNARGAAGADFTRVHFLQDQKVSVQLYLVTREVSALWKNYVGNS